MHTFRTQGVCARSINVEVEDGIVKHVDFVGGCNGNLKAISKLVEGKKVDDVCAVLDGNTCGNRPTSCADQLCRALREAEAAQ